MNPIVSVPIFVILNTCHPERSGVFANAKTLRSRRIPSASAAAVVVGILRLRMWFAERTTCSAQDDMPREVPGNAEKAAQR